MRYDDEFNEEMAYRADMQNMLNEHEDGKIARFAITSGFALLLYVVGALFIPTQGFHFLWFGVAIWLAFWAAERVTLYMWRRQMASEFSSEYEV